MSDFNPLWLVLALGALGAVFSIGMWVGNVNSDRNSFKAFMKEIREKVDKILERLPPSTETTGSPIRLTELGQKVSNEVDASSLARDLVPGLRRRVAEREAYDIQEICLRFVEHEYDPPPDVDSRIKKVAFNNGLDRRQVLRVIGLELRDMFVAD